MRVRALNMRAHCLRQNPAMYAHDEWDRLDAEEPGLVRYWFEFDLADDAPTREPGRIQLDGGTRAYRLLGRGAGVTGHNRGDCLRLLADVLGAPLPPVLHVLRSPPIGLSLAKEIGNPAWRGIWFPRLNIAGPVVD